MNIFAFQLATAQLAIIKDKDGYTNVRELPTSKSKVIDKVYDFEVFYAYDGTGGLDYEVPKQWDYILYNYEKTEYFSSEPEFGFMHRSRIQYLTDFDILNTSIIGSNFIRLKNDSNTIQVKIECDNFVDSSHHIEYKGKYNIIHIDGRMSWGTDWGMGHMLKTKINSISVDMDGNSIVLPTFAFDDLYNPNLSKTEVYVDKASSNLYITMLNSDGAGAYLVALVIHNGKYHSRFVGIPW